jgi:uncharacterized protein
MSSEKKRFAGHTALVTGASNGIGLELARVLAADGHDLVLVARSKDKLEALAAELGAAHGVKVTVMVADLARPEAPTELFAACRSAGIAVDVLVNNAGYGTFGRFADETALLDELAMIQVNVVALTHLAKLFVPGMVARKRGRILNVASTAAFQAGPLMAVYYASKAFVLSLSEALAKELEGTGVTVTALCPGPTESGFQGVARMQDSKLVAGKKMPTSATVALAGYRAMQRGRVVYVPGLTNKILAASVRFTPRPILRSIVKSMQERKH